MMFSRAWVRSARFGLLGCCGVELFRGRGGAASWDWEVGCFCVR